MGKVSLVGSYIQELELIKTTEEKSLLKRPEKIRYRFYPTSDMLKLAYKLGEIDMIENILDITPFEKWKTAVISPIIDRNKVVTLFFNTQSENLSEKSLRQALNYAIDKKFFGERAVSPISSKSWAFNPQVKKYEFDMERAKEIIEEFPEDKIDQTEIKLVSAPGLLSVAEVISDNWEQLGINTHIQVSSVIPQEFDAFLTILEISPDPDQYPIWHSTQESTNIAKYKSQRIDKLLEDGRVLLDVEERRKIYLDFQRFLMEELPAAILYYPVYYTVERS